MKKYLGPRLCLNAPAFLPEGVQIMYKVSSAEHGEYFAPSVLGGINSFPILILHDDLLLLSSPTVLLQILVAAHTALHSYLILSPASHARCIHY